MHFSCYVCMSGCRQADIALAAVASNNIITLNKVDNAVTLTELGVIVMLMMTFVVVVIILEPIQFVLFRFSSYILRNRCLIFVRNSNLLCNTRWL